MAVNFFIRTKETNPKTFVTIRLRLRRGRQISLYSKTNIRIPLELWNEKGKTTRQKIRDKSEYPDREFIKTQLEELSKHIESSLIKLKKSPDNEWLKETIDQFHNPDNYVTRPQTLFEFIAEFIENSKDRINSDTGKKIAPTTIKKYVTCFNQLKDFSDYTKKEVDFCNIDLSFYEQFTNYLSSKRDEKLAINTIGKQIATIKCFLNNATDRGINTNTEFKSKRFKVTTEKSDDIYLNEEELSKIHSLDLSKSPRLDKIRDLFLIGCWTGCRYSDFTKIKPENIRNKLIYIEQEKTGSHVIIPLHQVVEKILQKYEGVLPKSPSNQKFNKYIKEVCQLADICTNQTKGITKGGKREIRYLLKYELVKSHTARRSFATNLYKSGLPAITIMQITGHKTEQAFLKYLKLTSEEYAELLNKHWENQLSIT